MRKYNPIMHLAVIIFLVSASVSVCAAVPPGDGFTPPGGAPDGNRLVSVELISEFDTVAPGDAAMLGVRFRIEKDWHLYWLNPGETGLPPGFEFEAPEWLTIGEPRWPAPRRHEMPGPLVDFIFEKELVVLFPMQVAPEAPIGAEAEIRLNSDWLVCRTECLMGAGRAARTIRVASDSSRAPAARVIDEWRAKLPRRLDEVRDPPAQVTWRGDELVIEAPGADSITLFPFRRDKTDAMPADILRQGIAESERLVAAYNPDKNRDAAAARGVITIERDGRTSSWEFEAPRPASRPPVHQDAGSTD